MHGNNTILSKKRKLPENITRTKNGYHVRMVINGEYHAEYYSDLDNGKKEAFKKAREKRDELAKLRDKTIVKKTEYETRFLYETPNNSTGIIGVFYKETQGTEEEIYPYFCTTIVSEKNRPQSYSRSIKKWGKAEALLQICCIRKRHMAKTYEDRFDAKRFDKSVMKYMKENYLSYREQALERLRACIGRVG